MACQSWRGSGQRCGSGLLNTLSRFLATAGRKSPAPQQYRVCPAPQSESSNRRTRESNRPTPVQTAVYRLVSLGNSDASLGVVNAHAVGLKRVHR